MTEEWDENLSRSEYIGITMIRKKDPKHPYCTNWPVGTDKYPQKGDNDGVQKTKRSSIPKL